ncbi:hypothetical protein C8A00DRAFT_31059 [Chaetomidium leptoderma]|uniref:Uncharacterized protein n=1 Tax=Chaetomidium leptoderma TaxID=669021 RepID=A0AAN6ZZQ4_9PEZI|nr:hypothetical protein C8A00DRAFT_31059 [Chaetomidium leptoderma]
MDDSLGSVLQSYFREAHRMGRIAVDTAYRVHAALKLDLAPIDNGWEMVDDPEADNDAGFDNGGLFEDQPLRGGHALPNSHVGSDDNVPPGGGDDSSSSSDMYNDACSPFGGSSDDEPRPSQPKPSTRATCRRPADKEVDLCSSLEQSQTFESKICCSVDNGEMPAARYPAANQLYPNAEPQARPTHHPTHHQTEICPASGPADPLCKTKGRWKKVPARSFESARYDIVDPKLKKEIAKVKRQHRSERHAAAVMPAGVEEEGLAIEKEVASADAATANQQGDQLKKKGLAVDQEVANAEEDHRLDTPAVNAHAPDMMSPKPPATTGPQLQNKYGRQLALVDLKNRRRLMLERLEERHAQQMSRAARNNGIAGDETRSSNDEEPSGTKQEVTKEAPGPSTEKEEFSDATPSSPQKQPSTSMEQDELLSAILFGPHKQPSSSTGTSMVQDKFLDDIPLGPQKQPGTSTSTSISMELDGFLDAILVEPQTQRSASASPSADTSMEQDEFLDYIPLRPPASTSTSTSTSGEQDEFLGAIPVGLSMLPGPPIRYGQHATPTPTQQAGAGRSPSAMATDPAGVCRNPGGEESPYQDSRWWQERRQATQARRAAGLEEWMDDINYPFVFGDR